MRGTLGNGDVTMENRDPRFAELDAQIEAEQATRRQTPAPKPKRRRRPGPRLPASVRKEIARFARELRRQHRKFFTADPKLKDRAARFLRSLLPPKRKRGRPGIDSVTKAIRLRQRFRQQYPGEKPEQIWKRIYPEAIPGYASMDRERQKAERLLLRERVRSRRHRQRNHRPKLQGHRKDGTSV
jgi:hypothetical protein